MNSTRSLQIVGWMLVLFIGAGVMTAAGAFGYTHGTHATDLTYSRRAYAARASSASTTALHASSTDSTSKVPGHIPTPSVVQGIYMSQCVAGTPKLRDSLVKLIDDTQLNSVVIDIKDFSGGIAFPTTDATLAPFVSQACGAADMKEFVAHLHEKGIYVIGRITVFQDPLYASVHPEWAVQKKGGGVWKNYGGLAFIDVGAKPFWDHIITLARVSHDEIGFDEINFDYVRFPSDGTLSQAVFSHSEGKSKAQALEDFFAYLHKHMQESRITTSVDLFGLVTSSQDDLGIGQILERALPYFDYIDPMTYPSHYASGFNGFKDPNQHPYEVLEFEMKTAIARAVATSTSQYFSNAQRVSTSSARYAKRSYPPAVIRPWLQSFDYPVAYTPAMVSAQINAVETQGQKSWLFWDAANKYTSLRQVLKKGE